MQDADGQRGSWGTSVGFVLAAAGGAIGLGNIWGFPYTAAQSGGAAFVVLYVLCVALVGVPVLFAELAIGRSTQLSPVSAFRKLAPRSAWLMIGALGVLAGFAILAFYSVIASWTLGYLFKAITGEFAKGVTQEQSATIYYELAGNKPLVLFWTAAFLTMSILVIRRGIQGGIEWVCKILMPIFFVLLVGLAARSMTLEGAGEGVRFLFNFDLTKITKNPSVILHALSQAFFSLSLGMGAMVTYGSYLSKKENLPQAGVAIAFADTAVAILSGLMIFPALFAFGVEPVKDEKLVFVVLPMIFDKLPAGQIFAIAFYVLLIIAALTSAISLLEVITSFFVDERKWSRERAVWVFGSAAFALAVPCVLSEKFMSLLILIFFQYALLVGGFFICLFVGWSWSPKAGIAEMTANGRTFPGLWLWGFLIRYFCPLVIAIIVAFQVWQSLPADTAANAHP